MRKFIRQTRRLALTRSLTRNGKCNTAKHLDAICESASQNSYPIREEKNIHVIRVYAYTCMCVTRVCARVCVRGWKLTRRVADSQTFDALTAHKNAGVAQVGGGDLRGEPPALASYPLVLQNPPPNPDAHRSPRAATSRVLRDGLADVAKTPLEPARCDTNRVPKWQVYGAKNLHRYFPRKDLREIAWGIVANVDRL